MNNESHKESEQIIEALESPSALSQEELKELFSNKENQEKARSILLAKEVLARENIPAPNVNKEWEKFEKKHKKHSAVLIRISIAAAACMALLIGIGLSRSSNDNIRIFEASLDKQAIRQDTIKGVVTIHVPRGMQKQVKLPDGTIVSLNAESQLAYDIASFGQKERTVTLYGEALFDVVKDSLCPFNVLSNKLKTCVTGTVFNIRSYATEEPKVTLLSGAVKVSDVENKKSLNMNPGEQAVLTHNDQLRMITALQTHGITSWHEGNFYFDNQTLAEILCELGRWYNVSVIIKNQKRMNDRLHFKARRDEKLASVIELLNHISQEPVTLNKGTIIVGK